MGHASPQRSASAGPHILTLGLRLVKESLALPAMERGPGLRSLPPLRAPGIVHLPLPTLLFTSGGWSLDPRQSASMRSTIRREPAQKSFFVFVWFCVVLQKCLVQKIDGGSCLHVAGYLKLLRLYLYGKVELNMHKATLSERTSRFKPLKRVVYQYRVCCKKKVS